MSWNQTEGCNLTLTEVVRVFQKVAYIPVFVLGLLLNSTALYLFLLKRSSWTETHIYMINLALADFTLILILPLRIYLFFSQPDLWDICPVLFSAHFINMYASILTLAAISVHRYVGVKFPFSLRAGRSRKLTALAVCVLIWVVVVTISTTFMWANGKDQLLTCFERRSALPLPFLLVVLIVGFLLPLCTVLFCSGQTIFSLLNGAEVVIPHEKRKYVAIITANLIVFVLCFTPMHVMLLVKFSFAAPPQNNSSCAAYNLVHNILHVSEWIATTNCCLDSIAYYFLFKDILR